MWERRCTLAGIASLLRAARTSCAIGSSSPYDARIACNSDSIARVRRATRSSSSSDPESDESIALRVADDVRECLRVELLSRVVTSG